MKRKTVVSVATLAAICLADVAMFNAAQAFNMNKMFNPNKWFGDNDRYYDRGYYGRGYGPYGYGGGPYGYGGGPYGYGGGGPTAAGEVTVPMVVAMVVAIRDMADSRAPLS